jgi:hypothetical protein
MGLARGFALRGSGKGLSPVPDPAPRPVHTTHRPRTDGFQGERPMIQMNRNRQKVVLLGIGCYFLVLLYHYSLSSFFNRGMMLRE